MKRLMAGTLAVAASLAITASAHATPKAYYFDCTGDTPLSFASLGAPALSWSDTAPAGSLTSGAGCGQVDTWIQGTNPGNYVYDSVFGGSHKGAIKKLDLTVYGLRPGDGVLAGLNADITLQVDGQTVAKLANATGAPGTKPTPAGGLAATWTFSELDIPKGDHDYAITFSAHFTNDPFVTGWGAKEVPSGVKLYTYDDLTCEEQQHYDLLLECGDDE